MKQAQKIVGDGTDKMAKEVSGRGNTLWGSFFRGAFAMAAFKKMVNVLRQGTEELKRTGDAAATAAADGLAKYDAAMNKIAATAAKNLTPILGKAAEGLSNSIDASKNIIRDLNPFTGGITANRGRRQAEERAAEAAAEAMRMEAERANIRKIRMESEKKLLEERNNLIKDYKHQIEAAQTPIEKWAATLIKLKEDDAKGIFKDLPGGVDKLTKAATEGLQKALSLEGMPKTGFDQYEAEITRLRKAMQTIPAGLIDFGPALDKTFNELLTDLDFVFEAADKDDPFAKWTASMERFHELTKKVNITAEKGDAIQKGITDRLRKSVLEIEKSPLDEYTERAKRLMDVFHKGALKPHELIQQTGQALMNLAATQDKINEQSNKAPEALIRGTAAAFSAANEFMRSREKSGDSLDPQKLLADLAKKDAEKQAEQIRIGKAQLDAMRNKMMIEWVNQ